LTKKEASHRQTLVEKRKGNKTKTAKQKEQPIAESKKGDSKP
jgi:hypothetical protein